jgi:Predicted transcriptional regulator
MDSQSQTNNHKLLRVPAVLDRLGISRASLYKRLKEPGFPQQVRYGGCVAWIESEINLWIESCIRSSRGGSAEEPA